MYDFVMYFSVVVVFLFVFLFCFLLGLQDSIIHFGNNA